MIKSITSCTFLFFCVLITKAQDVELPLLYSLKTDFLYQSSQNQDSLAFPYTPYYSDDLSNTDQIPFVHIDSSKSGTWVGRKLFRENFLILDQKNIYLTVDPLFNFTAGVDQSDSENKTLYQNTRGVKIEGFLGEKFIFSTSFLENQARFPTYLSNYVENTGVVPGMGRVKDFKNGEYDYSMATASISYKINKNIRIKLGNDKDFLGFGYRSVLLSDNAFNYPHLKIDLTFAKGKLRYTLNYAALQYLVRTPDGETPESLFERKSGAFHYFSYLPYRNVSVGIFSGTIFPQNTLNTSSYWDVFNPIFLFNPIFNHDKYYSKVGLNAAWAIFKSARIYGEVANDSDKWNQLTWLAGVALFNIVKGLDITFEYSMQKSLFENWTSPGTALFSHYNQSLAHALGSGYKEYYVRFHYSIKKIHFLASLNFANRKYIDASFWGFLDLEDYPNAEEDFNSKILNTELFYMLNPKTNMNIAIGYQLRRVDLIGIEEKTDYLYFSFRTSLFNEYRDF